MKNLKDFLTNPVPSIKTLPILHSCEAINLQSILESGKLNPSACDVFHKDYLYAFYGIPSYRRNKPGATANPGYYPVCFIIDYDHTKGLNRLHPCDTGAFEKIPSVKADHFHEDIKIEDLEMDPNIDEAKKLIGKFYLNNNNYIRQMPKLNPDQVGVVNNCAWSYASLINDKSLTNYDNRVATIELIFASELLLNDSNLIQIILPALYFDDPDIESCLVNKYKISAPLIYETIKGSPNEFFGTIYNLYLNFVKSNNLV